jgi:RHS repeat-associated protein
MAPWLGIATRAPDQSGAFSFPHTWGQTMRSPIGAFLRLATVFVLGIAGLTPAKAATWDMAHAYQICQQGVVNWMSYVDPTPYQPYITVYCKLVITSPTSGYYVAKGMDYDVMDGGYTEQQIIAPWFYSTEPPKNCPTGRCGANDVNPGTGSRNTYTPLYQGAGAFPLSLGVGNNSLDSGVVHGGQTGRMGVNQAHSYQRSIVLVAGTDGQQAQEWAFVELASGNVEKFVFVNSQWVPSTPDVRATLQRTYSGTTFVGWLRADPDGTTEAYNSSGQLTHITNRAGQTQTLVYDAACAPLIGGGTATAGGCTGKLQYVQDPNGRRLQFYYYPDANQSGQYQTNGGKISNITLPDGGNILFSYGTSGVLSQITFPGGATKKFLYNEAGHTDPSDPHQWTAITGIVGADGQRSTSIWYNAAHLVTRVEEHGGVGRHDYAYGLSGQTITSSTTTNPLGGTDYRTYTAINGKVLQTSQTLNCTGCTPRTSTTTYDAAGNPDVTTDAAGAITDRDYDAYGQMTQRVQAKTKPEQQTLTVQWDNALRVPTQVNRTAQTKIYTYNARGQVLTATVRAGSDRKTIYAYCDAVDTTACPLVGLLRAVNGPRTDVSDLTVFAYRMADAATCASAPTTCAYRKGDLYRITNAAGQFTQILAYDGAGRIKSLQDINGVVIDVEYDARGQATARKIRGIDNTTEADDAITRIEYLPTGPVKKVTSPDGSFVAMTYDEAQRLTDVTDSLGNTIHYTLDAAGNRAQEDTKNNAGIVKHTLARAFDGLSRLQSELKGITGATQVAPLTQFTYDANGAIDQVTDPMSRISDSNVDALGRLVQSITNVNGAGADKATSTFGYDQRDNLVRVTDPKGLDTVYTYNGFDDLTQLASPDTGTTNYTYNTAGNPTSKLDARGMSTTYTYDLLDRLTAESHVSAPSLNVTYTYDAPQADCTASEVFGKGRVAKMTDETGSTRYCYDRFGNLVRKVQTTNGVDFTTGATYNSAGRLLAMTYPSGAIVTFTRNANGQVTRVDAKPTATSAQVTIVSSMAYSPFGPVTSTTYGNGRVMSRSYDMHYGVDAQNDGVVADGLYENYVLDANDNVIAVYERASIYRGYQYDGQNRLKAVTGGAAETYTYDATGNRLSKTIGATTNNYTYATTSHLLTNISGVSARTYDANGNTLAHASLAWTYDARNRPRELRSGGTLVRTWYYNGKGERVRRVINNAPTTNTVFVYDEAGHLIGEYNDAGGRVAEYVWADGQLVAVLKPHDGTYHQYVETDHLGTPRAIIHPVKNTTIWRWDLTGSAFGEHLADTDPDGNAAAYGFNLRYPGQYWDGILRINYNYFRDYDAQTGRYTQSDPIGLLGGASTYSYVNGNPLNHFDSNGHAPQLGVGLALLCGGSFVGGYATADSMKCAMDEFSKDTEARARENANTPEDRMTDNGRAMRDGAQKIADGSDAGADFLAKAVRTAGLVAVSFASNLNPYTPPCYWAGFLYGWNNGDGSLTRSIDRTLIQFGRALDPTHPKFQ